MLQEWEVVAVTQPVFPDREAAGRQLGRRLQHLEAEDPVVLGLPRGGVPVADEVAKQLHAPLDVVVVRKLGVPDQPELAMGAIGEGGVGFLERRLVDRLGIGQSEVSEVEERERHELDARVERLRRGRPAVRISGRTVIVVDDGFATGATARVACRVARLRGAAKVVLGVPVGPDHTRERVPEADEVVTLMEPEGFTAVGNHYVDFSPTTDEDVSAILDAAASRAASTR